MNKSLYISNRKSVAPATVITLSFFALVIAGAVLFTLPFMTRDGEGLSFLTALFTATSSVCVTGLTLIDPATTLALPGQLLLAFLIEAGGISMVTFASFFMFSFKKKNSLRSVRLAQEYTDFDDFSQIKSLVRVVVGAAFFCQLLGALLLCIRFVPKYGLKGVWISVFTAISAYCNAGFDLLGHEQKFGSLVNYNDDPLVMFTVMGLIILGGLGFFVFYDIITYRKTKKITLHTKIVIIFTVLLLIFGFAAFFICEYNNKSTIGEMSLYEKIIASLFQSVTARTAGFASVDLVKLNDLTKVIMMLLMFIGAGSGSTGGGIKITTFSVIMLSILSVIKGREETTVFSHRLSQKTVVKSMAIVFLGLSVVFGLSCCLFAASPQSDAINIFFESVSAFATVGVTVGITASCNTFGLVALIFTMFIGRVGPVGFVLALSSKERTKHSVVRPEGKIMVG